MNLHEYLLYENRTLNWEGDVVFACCWSLHLVLDFRYCKIVVLNLLLASWSFNYYAVKISSIVNHCSIMKFSSENTNGIFWIFFWTQKLNTPVIVSPDGNWYTLKTFFEVDSDGRSLIFQVLFHSLHVMFYKTYQVQFVIRFRVTYLNISSFWWRGRTSVWWHDFQWTVY